MARRALHLTGDGRADRLLTDNPLALLLGMVLDQQFPMERAFAAPAILEERIGGVDAATIAAMEPDALVAAFKGPPALHRYPGSMASRVQEICRLVRDTYGGDASEIWRDAPDGPTLRARLEALPGFGSQKARIFMALLGKQRGVRPPGWQEASDPYGEPGSFRSVADVVDSTSLTKVRETKAAAKAETKAAARTT